MADNAAYAPTYGQTLTNKMKPAGSPVSQGFDPLVNAQNESYQSQADSADAQDRQFKQGMQKRVMSMMDSFGNGGGASGNQPPASMAPISMPDTTDAQSQAFARAKDQAGQATRGALTSLRSELGSTGMLGSGNEATGTARVLQGGAQNLSDVGTQQAMTNADIARQTAQTEYEGGIQQRGQNITAQTAANQQNLERLKTVLASFGSMY